MISTILALDPLLVDDLTAGDVLVVVVKAVLALVLLLTPLLGLVPALVAGAASGTSADGRLTFSYTARAR